MKLPAPPSWFTVGGDRPSQWRSVRVPPEGADAWLLAIADCWEQSASRLAIQALFEPYAATLPLLAQDVKRTSWHTQSGWELVFALESGVSVEVGLATFLPTPYNHLFGPVGRRVLYAHILLANAVEALDKDPAATGGRRFLLPLKLRHKEIVARALLPALRAEYFRLAKPFAVSEILRRAEKRDGQFGCNAAILLLTDAAIHQLGLGSSAPDLQEQALERLRRGAMSKKRKNLPLLIAVDSSPLWKSPARTGIEDWRREVTGRIWESIPSVFRNLDSLESLARGAQGELNVIVHAIHHNLLQDVRKIQRQRRLVARGWGTIEDGTERLTIDFEPDADETPPHEKIPSKERLPDERLDRREFLEGLRNTEVGRRIFRAVEEGAETKQEVAKALHLSPRELGRLVQRIGRPKSRTK